MRCTASCGENLFAEERKRSIFELYTFYTYTYVYSKCSDVSLANVLFTCMYTLFDAKYPLKRARPGPTIFSRLTSHHKRNKIGVGGDAKAAVNRVPASPGQVGSLGHAHTRTQDERIHEHYQLNTQPASHRRLCTYVLCSRKVLYAVMHVCTCTYLLYIDSKTLGPTNPYN